MRTGKYNGPAMTYVNPRFTPAECENAAIATTTTAPDTRTCAQGGLCRVGDEGQRGGVVIAVNNSKPRGQRNVEMAKYGWLYARGDCEQSGLFNSCIGGEWAEWKASGTGDHYRFPTVAELQSIRFLSQANKDKLGLRDSSYYSSENCGRYMTTNVPLESWTEGGSQAMSYNITDAHCAVRWKTGDPSPEIIAFTRPVRNF